ncbi:MAG: hypothetical protein OEM01_14985 [Desulfobulbaceae bacterium]|nr:hypothetical protein [Desulfobulbaceae bacterium]
MVLIFLLAYAGVNIWYNRLEETMLASLPAKKTVKAMPAEKKMEIIHKSDDYRIVIDRNIFGAALDKKVEETDSIPVEELKPTTLKLSLMGTVFGNQKDSRAIIADETSRKQDIYAAGDTIQGALIKVIERRRVILRVNGKDEILSIKEREGGPADNRLSAAPEPVVRRSLRDRLNARMPTVRPSLPNRPRPVIIPPGGSEENEIESGGTIEDNSEIAEENSEPLPDQDTEQPEDTDAVGQEQLEEPDFMDSEPLDAPELKDEERY